MPQCTCEYDRSVAKEVKWHRRRCTPTGVVTVGGVEYGLKRTLQGTFMCQGQGCKLGFTSIDTLKRHVLTCLKPWVQLNNSDLCPS